MIKAKIIAIDPERGHITVEYQDPYGHKPITGGIAFDTPFTKESVIKSVIRYYPAVSFKEQDEVIRAMETMDKTELDAMVGTIIEADEPSSNTSHFSSEVY